MRDIAYARKNECLLQELGIPEKDYLTIAALAAGVPEKIYSPLQLPEPDIISIWEDACYRQINAAMGALTIGR